MANGRRMMNGASERLNWNKFDVKPLGLCKYCEYSALALFLFYPFILLLVLLHLNWSDFTWLDFLLLSFYFCELTSCWAQDWSKMLLQTRLIFCCCGCWCCDIVHRPLAYRLCSGAISIESEWTRFEFQSQSLHLVIDDWWYQRAIKYEARHSNSERTFIHFHG